MSSTNRGGDSYVDRQMKSDYYRTPIKEIEHFLKEFIKHEPNAFRGTVLDPCAGGDKNNPMSYPTALTNIGVSANKIETIDIRADSKAKLKENYIELELDYAPSTIITNPPFLYAIEVIEKALKDVKQDGFVIMLLRLNFFGGKKRMYLWNKHMPKYCFVHHKRMSFTDNKKTDSIEYAHFVWQNGYHPTFSDIKVI